MLALAFLSRIQVLEFTLPESLGLFGDKPVSRLDVGDLRIGEEFLDRGNSLIGNITGLRSSDEKRRSAVLDTPGFTKWEVCHVFK